MEEKVKENGGVKSSDEKPSRPVTEEKPADTNAGQTKSAEAKEESAQENWTHTRVLGYADVENCTDR